ASKENPTAGFNKIDLSQLQGFSFGTQWSKDKEAATDERDRTERQPREDRMGARANAPDRRDRRAFQKASGDGPPLPPRDAPSDRAPRREGGERGMGTSRGAPGMDRQERGPYESPFFDVAFFPEDLSFNALVKMIRSSARTIELFEIARTVLGKPDRFVVVVSRKLRQAAAPDAPAEPIHVSVPDGVPFESEDDAVGYALERFIGNFYDRAEVEVDAPKGNFLVINKCGVTGELLGPPNYHRYAQMVQEHHASRLTRMPFEAFRARIETVRDPEVVNRWLEKMRKVTRYTWKGPMAEGEAAPAFDTFEEARQFLLTRARDTVVKPVPNARFHGKALETMPRGEILMAIEGAYERQLRFPLDTANQLRGRLRREHFTIFKKGSKGVSYVCAVKRKFRVPGQVFSESIGSLISFIEAHPLVRAGDLALKMLGIAAPAEGEQVTQEQRERIMRMQGDLIWLVREGYVTEFIDGGLYAPPVMAETRKKDSEVEEVDPENFPEPSPALEATAPGGGTPAAGAGDAGPPDAGDPGIVEPAAGSPGTGAPEAAVPEAPAPEAPAPLPAASGQSGAPPPPESSAA
ncbi:MAG TPA: hypothetical protein VKG78_06145, partial [Opitutaceae bacterium]|nr:hypothetical protein [Opitutaceae bacterium]